MYNKFDVFNKKVLVNKPNPRELYVVDVECDANDGDYMRTTLEFDKESFEDDELLLLILSYVSKLSGKFVSGWCSCKYGDQVAENEGLPWLEDYLHNESILIYAGMCDCMCHSVTDIEITYYDEYGHCYIVELPDIDSLFETEEEFNNYVTDLYNKTA